MSFRIPDYNADNSALRWPMTKKVGFYARVVYKDTSCPLWNILDSILAHMHVDSELEGFKIINAD